MDLNAIAEAALRGTADPSCVVGCHDRRTTLTEPAFVGRRDELEQLEKQIRRASAGEAGLVVIEAESGGGKSRLLTEIAQRGLQAGMWILRGQGSQQVGQQPYRILSGIVDNLIAAAGTSPEFAKALYDGLGDNVNSVADALPKLADALGWKTSKITGPAAFAETRSIQALVAAARLSRLGRAAGNDSSGRLPVGGRDDAQGVGPLAIGSCRGNAGAVEDIADCGIPFGGSLRGTSLASDAAFSPSETCPFQRGGSAAADRVNGRAFARRGHRRRFPAVRRQPFHGLRGVAGDGGVRRAGGRRSGLAHRTARPGRSALVVPGGRIPFPAFGTPPAGGDRPDDGRRDDGKRVRSAVGREDCRNTFRRGRGGAGRGPRPTFHLDAPREREMHLRA